MQQTLHHPPFAHRLGSVFLIAALLWLHFSPTAWGQTTDDPALWLQLDEVAGATTFADNSGNGNNGTCAAPACPISGATGRIGQAAQFDGVDDRVQINLNTPGAAYTLAVWVNFSGAEWGGWRTLLEFGDDAPWFGVTPTGQLTLYPVIFGGAVPLGQWAHVAYTWSGTENRLYINGQAVATTTGTPPGGGQGLSLALETGTPNPWSGLLDDMRVYPRALSAAEIGQLANPNAGPVVQPPQPPPDEPAAVRLIDLTISIYKPVTTPAERQPYEDLFRLFADSIYEVSNGVHKIRTITIYDSGRFADRADIQWIQFEQQPRATTNGYGRGRGTVHMGDAIFDANTSITDPNATATFLNTLAHEWGHYFYGVLDEYAGTGTSQDPGSPRQGDTPPEPCSVMCVAFPEVNFATLNFSTPKSTVGANRTNTAHFRTFNASGWETVARTADNDPPAIRGQRLFWADLAAQIPVAGQDSSVELPAQRNSARSAFSIVWADVNATAVKHRVFLVDVSADMGTGNKLESAKLALRTYIDRANIGDRIGIITFADTHTVVQPLTAIDGDATRNAIKVQIDAIQAKAGTNDRLIAPADQAAIAALQQAATNALIVDRGIYTIIDGGYTDQTQPFIFQKICNDHSSGGSNIPFSVFNYAAQPKPNDLFGNALDLLQFSTTCSQPQGTYQFVGAGGFAIPTQQAGAATTYAIGSDHAAADDLVDALEATDQAFSPVVDVNLGTARDLVLEVGQPFSATIYVDDTLDEVEVAVFFSGDPDGVDIALVDPNGDPSDPPACDYDAFDSYCFFLVSAPLTGTWELEAEAISQTIDLEYEALGYALDGSTYQATLESQAGNYVAYPEEVVLVASLSRIDRIAQAGIEAWYEDPEGEFFDLTLQDDGVAPDQTADDGLYTGLLPYDQPGDYDVTVVFDNIEGAAFFTQAGMADVLEPVQQPVADDFDRFASLAILVGDYADDDHDNGPDTATDLLADNGDVPGRIDAAGDSDTFRITAPQALEGNPKGDGMAIADVDSTAERYIVRLTHFAFGMNARVQVTTGSGTTEYTTGALAYDGYWVLPLDLKPGDVVLVEVSQADGTSAAGLYDISFGRPLSGEPAAPNTPDQGLFLPLLAR